MCRRVHYLWKILIPLVPARRISSSAVSAKRWTNHPGVCCKRYWKHAMVAAKAELSACQSYERHAPKQTPEQVWANLPLEIRRFVSPLQPKKAWNRLKNGKGKHRTTSKNECGKIYCCSDGTMVKTLNQSILLRKSWFLTRYRFGMNVAYIFDIMAGFIRTLSCCRPVTGNCLRTFWPNGWSYLAVTCREENYAVSGEWVFAMEKFCLYGGELVLSAASKNGRRDDSFCFWGRVKVGKAAKLGIFWW